MFNKFLEVTAKYGATTGYLFVKAASHALSVADVIVARETDEANVVTAIVAGCNIDDPNYTVCGLPMAYKRPDLVCGDVLRFLSVEMDWDLGNVLAEFGFLVGCPVDEEVCDEPEMD